MFEAAFEALGIILSPDRLIWVLAGTCLGLFLGIVPGLGGMVGMAVLLPFVYGMDPYSGIALLIGMMAVVQTGDTFPAVLIGVPGTVGGAATIMDGYPMARKGQAGRALGAAFSASMLGGLFGAFLLFAILPVARPLVLAFGSPELFMLSVFGLSLVAVLSRGAPAKGILAGLLGVLLATVGLAPASTDNRYTFDWLYLMSGINLVVVALALFAIPEIIELITKGTAIAGHNAKLTGGMRQGIRDTLRNKRLLLQGSSVGAGLGLLPGVGGSAINWIAYGIAKSTVRKKNRFGKGDVRGVIAPEAAQNATEGGALIPTLLFAIPGGGTTAILLGGLVLLGINPGPDMLEQQNLPVLLTIVWTLTIANVLGTLLCLGLARPVSMLTLIPGRLLGSFLFVIIIIAAYQASHNWGDVILVLGLGLLAMVMKRLDWPRVPLLIGFVLGPGAERYFTISTSRFGAEWLTNPGVIIIGLLIIAAVTLGLRQERDVVETAIARATEPADDSPAPGTDGGRTPQPEEDVAPRADGGRPPRPEDDPPPRADDGRAPQPEEDPS